MRYPNFIKKGDTIGFVAPSFACTTEPYKSAFDNAIKKFNELGYNVELGPNCNASCGIGKSNAPEKCGEEINDMYCTEDTNILISCGGGELMCEDLDFIDFNKLANAAPKWFVGFSDNTNLVFPLTTMCDTAAVYAPCAPAFGMEPWSESIHDLYELLTGSKLKFSGYDKWEKESLKTPENPCAPYNLTEESSIRSYPYRDASFNGRLVGGCLDCLVELVGTKYDNVKTFCERYKNDGIIWFLEACDLNTMSVRRALWHMEHAGWFRYVKGFIIGRPMHFDEECCGLDQYDAVTGILGKYGVPIIMDVDFGHLPPAIPIISGSMAEVSVKGNSFSIEMHLK